MQTAFLLLAAYGNPLIPAERVASDFFGLSMDKFMRKTAAGEIPIPIVRLERSQKANRSIHVADLAKHIDDARKNANDDLRKILGDR